MSDLPGVYMDEEYALMAHHPQRDAYSAGRRAQAWRDLQALHDEARETQRIPYQHYIYLLSGDMGDGKSLVAAWMMARLYAQGLKVFSNASLLFGRRVDTMDVYMLEQSLPENCALFMDEAHTLADVYGEQSNRQRLLSNALSMLRKKGVRLLLASAHESRVAMSIRAECDMLLYPRRSRRRPDKPTFPPFCYMTMQSIGPRPWRGRRLGDEWGLGRAGGRIKRRIRRLNPLDLYRSGMLMDSFERPDITAGIQTTADALRREMAQRSDASAAKDQLAVRTDEAETFLRAIWDARQRGEFDEPKYHFRRVADIARAYGSPWDDKETIEFIRLHMAIDSRYKVAIDDFDQFYQTA